jgi:hypothetical protein
MLHQPRSLKRSLAAGLAVCAIAPATAVAAPAVQGQAVAAGGGPGVSAEQFAPQNLTAPDQVDRVTTKPQPAGAPTWPANPRAVGVVQPASSAQPSDDGGLDTGVWIALGGGVLVIVGGLGLAGRTRLRIGSQRQPA